ncbi:ankyrin repeats (3 copies) domain-containing protein [Trichoderma breve]|uniref:Ankyrin repeats (3 copies) domain-containing protein n=1 Tax=Trichoderma breve TaxID=2034170 RepID=A0A9W9BEK8_9HYPO|nr:ankyrin repeats (3 copies) domain-containing protein [Trichoderma breve]KAJ4858421.1 ankyrin repeats (3 copies) domain-containing protein [Trichoderma breve]
MTISGTESKSGPILNLYDDAREMETISLFDGDTFEQKKILSAISNCIFGKLGAVSQYLETSTEAKLFLHGKDETGNTTLIMAAAEKSNEMVSLLLQKGADVDATNNNGRSALMEAALWGRLRSVKALLESNASKCVKDRHGRSAMDLAQPTRRNEKERYSRSSRAAADNVPERDRDRRHIAILLSDSNGEKRHAYTGPLSESERNNYFFRKSESEMVITLHGPIQSYHVLWIKKTAAVLDRGNQFARISATSGWGVDSLPPNVHDMPSWTEQVYYIASIIGHRFEEPQYLNRDQGKPGQYYACHAEKKLIAYFLDKHVFLPKDRQPDQALEDSILEVETSLEEGKHLSIVWAKVCDLEERKTNLDRQLFSADDRLLGESYDEQEVNKLKRKIHTTDEELSSLESDTFVTTMRAQQKKERKLSKKEKTHRDLMKLSRNEPSISLKSAVILSSNKICQDCDTFRKLVNARFQLHIEMNWRIIPEVIDGPP